MGRFVILIHESALKHGISQEDTLAAAEIHVFTQALDEENPWRELRLGFDRGGRLLELAVLIFDHPAPPRTFPYLPIKPLTLDPRPPHSPA